MAGLGDVAGLLKQAQKMQQDMVRAQEELRTQEVQGSAGGGAVTIRFNGAMEVLSVKIDREAIDPNDPDALEDLMFSAIKLGLEKSRELGRAHLSRLTGGLSLPGIM